MAGSLTILIKDIKRNHNPAFLFVEPCELVITKEIRTAISMGLRDLTYEIGPFITLVDGPTFDFLWRERRRLILNHILGADLVAISRADSVGSDRLETVQNILEQHFNKNHILSLSVTLDRGVEEVVDTIL